MALRDYIDRFGNLNVNKKGTHSSPHKVALLLAVMDLVEAGYTTDNQIYFDQRLKDSFSQYFARLRSGNDQDKPVLPFYHLRSEGFWHLQSRTYDTAETKSPSEKWLREAVAFAWVDPELFEYFRSPIARPVLQNALAENLDIGVSERILTPANGWAWEECEYIVQDYFKMLDAELRGEPYVKAEYNRHVQEVLQGERSRGSIEKKFQNISAILNQAGLPYIDGYKPLSNYQKNILPDVVGAYMQGHKDQVADPTLLAVADAEVPYKTDDILQRAKDAPERDQIGSPAPKSKEGVSYVPPKIDYLAREAKNRRLGLRGEEFILAYEKARLIDSGKSNLADQIDHISLHDDRVGFDIKSYNRDGSDRFIEVKTTNSGRFADFFVSPNEVNTSQKHQDHYYLYRVYSFRRDPRFYVKAGAIGDGFRLEASGYRARV